jgi:hypothetical protein
MIITAGRLVQVGDLLTMFERDIHRDGRGWDGPAQLATVLAVPDRADTGATVGFEMLPVILPAGPMEHVAGHPMLLLDLLTALSPTALRHRLLPDRPDATVHGLMISLEVLKKAGPADWDQREAARVQRGELDAHQTASVDSGRCRWGRLRWDRIEARLVHLVDAAGDLMSIARLRPSDEVIAVDTTDPAHEDWLSPGGQMEDLLRKITATLCAGR